jgi:hypothetical protein
MLKAFKSILNHVIATLKSPLRRRRGKEVSLKAEKIMGYK